jgi:hypothetical protein
LLSEELETQLKDVEELGIDLSYKDGIKRKIHKEYL